MPRLIHLNGPPRVGKSTLARRYAADHPGCVALDIDLLVADVDGWHDDFSRAHAAASARGRTAIAAHLRAGRDVVVPQLFTVHDAGPGFEVVAGAASAEYVEVVLLVERGEHTDRVAGKRPGGDVEAAVQQLVGTPGRDLLDRIDEHLARYLEGRPASHSLDTTGIDEDETYRRLLALLDRTQSSSS